MTKFNKSQWSKADFAQGYIDGADIFIVERKRLFEILKSFYKHFIENKPEIKILDLGCGDGVVTHELLKTNNSATATLIDGSEDMLNKAKNRLKIFENIHFIQASFQDILDGNVVLENYDFIVSSLAIHHLTMSEKEASFKTIYSHLNTDGFFLNIDVILAPTGILEDWYLSLWKEWISQRKTMLKIESSHYDDIIQRYKDSADNKPDTLDEQLGILKSIGFKNVDCYYKYGIFTMFGGNK